MSTSQKYHKLIRSANYRGIILLFLCAPHLALSEIIKSSGLEDIDHIRERVSEYSTTAENAGSRRAALLKWWRLMWRRGQDMTPFDAVANTLLNTAIESKANWETVDRAYAVLEDMWKNPEFIPQKYGERRPYNGIATDWPYYMGPTKLNNGYSPDQGPSEGKLAWRFPKGKKWEAVPIVEGGKIYLSSPGIDVLAFCLDETKGIVI